MKGLNVAKGLMAALVLGVGLLLAQQATAQTLDGNSALSGPAALGKSTALLLSNVNWVGEDEAITILMDERAQLATQTSTVSSKPQKAALSVRYDYYWVLAKTIKNGSTVEAAVVNTYDYLQGICAEMDNLVLPDDVLQDVVTLLSN